jgi:hypothetical protein
VRRTALWIGLIAAIVAASVAEAAGPNTWTVCPSGCNYTDIQSAVANASTMSGDTIDIKASGSPYVVNNLNHINDTGKRLIIQGDPSGPRPVITDSTPGDTPVTISNTSSGTSPPSILQHVEIDATGSASPTAVSLTGYAEHQRGSDGHPATLIDAIVNSTGVGVAMNAGVVQQAIINGTTNGVTSGAEGGFVSDAVVTASAGTALLAMQTNTPCTGGCDPPHDLQAVNVDAIAKGPGFGLEAQNTPDTTVNFAGTIAATNVIARGGTKDISGDAASGGANPLGGQVFVDHSNFVSSTGITSAGDGNQSGDPRFVNPVIGASENFHLQAGSPAIAAGTVDEPFSHTDADGNPFFSPPEIGAYRMVHPSPPPPPPPPTCAGAFVYPGLTANKKGKITVTFHFPCKGTLNVNAFVRGKKGSKTRWGKSVSISRNGAGLVVIRLKPNEMDKDLLAAARSINSKVKVTVAVKFTSFLGHVSKKSKSIKIK